MEIAAHRSGSAEFALVDESPDLLVLAYRFGSLPWCDAPFEIHRHHEEDRVWPAGGSEDPIAFRTVLVDAGSGVVAALRVDVLGVAFSNAIRVAVAEQLLRAEESTNAAMRLRTLYEQHPTTEDLVHRRALHLCHSDEPALGAAGPVSAYYY